MASDQYRKIVKRLYDRSVARSLDWSEVPFGRARNESYQVTLGLNTVRITGMQDKYRIELINSDGKTADSFTDEDIEYPDGEHNAFKTMSEIFGMAARRALGADQVLDEILKDLDDDIPF